MGYGGYESTGKDRRILLGYLATASLLDKAPVKYLPSCNTPLYFIHFLMWINSLFNFEFTTNGSLLSQSPATSVYLNRDERRCNVEKILYLKKIGSPFILVNEDEKINTYLETLHVCECACAWVSTTGSGAAPLLPPHSSTTTYNQPYKTYSNSTYSPRVLLFHFLCLLFSTNDPRLLLRSDKYALMNWWGEIFYRDSIFRNPRRLSGRTQCRR